MMKKAFRNFMDSDQFVIGLIYLVVIIVLLIAAFLSDKLFDYLVENKEKFFGILLVLIGSSVGITYHFAKKSRYDKPYGRILNYSFSFPHGNVQGVVLKKDENNACLYFYENCADFDKDRAVVDVAELPFGDKERYDGALKKYQEILDGINEAYSYSVNHTSTYYSRSIEDRTDCDYKTFFKERIKKEEEAFKNKEIKDNAACYLIFAGFNHIDFDIVAQKAADSGYDGYFVSKNLEYDEYDYYPSVSKEEVDRFKKYKVCSAETCEDVFDIIEPLLLDYDFRVRHFNFRIEEQL